MTRQDGGTSGQRMVVGARAYTKPESTHTHTQHVPWAANAMKETMAKYETASHTLVYRVMAVMGSPPFLIFISNFPFFCASVRAQRISRSNADCVRTTTETTTTPTTPTKQFMHRCCVCVCVRVIFYLCDAKCTQQSEDRFGRFGLPWSQAIFSLPALW